MDALGRGRRDRLTDSSLHVLPWRNDCRVDVCAPDCQSAAGTPYYKEKQGRLQRYRLYRLGDQLLLDLPEGTAVPLASCVEELSFYPAGKLKAGEVLTLTLQVKRQLLRPQLRSAVVAKNLSGEEA